MIYFDNAATGRFKPRSMYDVMLTCLHSAANPGRSGHPDSLKAAQYVYDARQYIKSSSDAEAAKQSSQVIVPKRSILQY